MTSTVRIDGIEYTYDTLPKREIEYVSLKDLQNFQQWKVYKGKRLASDYLMQWDNGDFVVFFDKEIHEYFMTERQYKLGRNNL